MPKRLIIRTETYPYHVVARSNNQEWFYLNTNEIWEIFSNYLFFISKAYGIKIHAFVLMSNHFHLLVTTPKNNLDISMNYLLRESSKTINGITNRINHNFGGPYKWSVITNPYYYAHALKYIYRNPVAVGLVDRVEDYKFSSLYGLLRNVHLGIPIESPIPGFAGILPGNVEEFLNWLNTSYDDKSLESIRKALKKQKFEFSVDNKTRKFPRNLMDNI